MTAVASHYETLGIESDAPVEDVRAAYTRLVKVVHPDHGGGAALFRAVREAYEELSDPARRAAYDASLSAGAGGDAAYGAVAQEEAPHESPTAGPQDQEWSSGAKWATGATCGQWGTNGQAAPTTTAPATAPAEARQPRIRWRASFSREHPQAPCASSAP